MEILGGMENENENLPCHMGYYMTGTMHYFLVCSARGTFRTIKGVRTHRRGGSDGNDVCDAASAEFRTPFVVSDVTLVRKHCFRMLV